VSGACTLCLGLHGFAEAGVPTESGSGPDVYSCIIGVLELPAYTTLRTVSLSVHVSSARTHLSCTVVTHHLSL